MSDYKVGFNRNNKRALLLGSASTLPVGFVEIGSFNHGSVEPDSHSHVLYHHVRDALYKQGVQDMHMVKILLDGDYVPTPDPTPTPTPEPTPTPGPTPTPTPGPTDPTLQAPEASWASQAAITQYPPRPVLSLPYTTMPGDRVTMQVSPTSSFASSNEQTVTYTAGSSMTFTQLGLITNGVTWLRWRVDRAGVGVSAWSPVLKHGSTAPATVTSSLAISRPENSPVAFDVVASEIGDWSILSDDDWYEAYIQKKDATTATVYMFDTPDYENKAAYKFQLRFVNAAGIVTDSVANLTITDVAELSATTLNPAVRNQFATLSNNNLTVNAIDTLNAAAKVRATNSRSGKYVFEALIATSGTEASLIGLVGSDTTKASNFDQPGRDMAGACIVINPPVGENAGILTIYGSSNAGGAGSGSGTTYPMQARSQNRYRCAFDSVAGKAWFGDSTGWLNGDPAAGTGGVAINIDAWFAVFGPFEENQITAVFSGLVYPLPAGFAEYY